MEPILNKDGKDFYCPVQLGISLINGKWKMDILWSLLNFGTSRFSELKKRLPDITEKMLISVLRELEADKIVSRKVYPTVPPKVEYSITPFGKSLQNVMEALKGFGERYLSEYKKEL